MSKFVQEDFDGCEWLTITGAVRYSGLGRSLIYELIQENLLVSSTVKRPGRTRGRRLVQRASLDRLIEEGIGGKSDDNTGKLRARLLGDQAADLRDPS
jgi:hypothetical protein